MRAHACLCMWGGGGGDFLHSCITQGDYLRGDYLGGGGGGGGGILSIPRKVRSESRSKPVLEIRALYYNVNRCRSSERLLHVCRGRESHAIGPYEDLTSVERRNLKWYGHVTRSSGLAREQFMEGAEEADRRNDGKTTLNLTRLALNGIS